MNSVVSRVISVCVAVLATLAFSIPDAEARRLGGGRSIGQQSGNVTQRSVAPAQPAAAPQAPARPTAAAAPARSGNRWLGPIAGIAAGLGLAALASHLGFGEELASFMLIALVVLAAVVAFRMLASRRSATGMQPAYQGGYSTSSVGQEAAVRYSPLPQAAAGTAAPVTTVGAGGAAEVAPPTWGVPADLDVAAFVRTAKVQFVRLQAVFDAGDLDDLREFTTPEMYAELKLEIDERRGASNRTDVVTLDAQLLGVETTAAEHVASVRFTGMIREQADGEAKPFDEVWNLVKPVEGSTGWVLAGIQQLG